jgi:alpha/beta superfamily hydrolase
LFIEMLKVLMHRRRKPLILIGIAVLRFDFTGIGASEGEFANAGFSANVADLSPPLTTCGGPTVRRHC